MSYGLVVLALILSLNNNEVSIIIQEIIGNELHAYVYNYVLLGSFVVCVAVAIKYYFDKTLSLKLIANELLLLFVFLVVFKISNLIWSFAIYFILWHSIPSILEQLDYLYKDVSWNSFIKYIKKSFLAWLISIVGISTLLYLFKDDKKVFLPIIFSFLGAITFAHSFVISKMFKKKSSTF
jgi:Brp/Blh family beta-carotene 15,15'-monooxygenase